VVRPLARWYRRRVIRRTRVIAVVGSLGKTTARRMVEAALGGRLPARLPSNFGVRLAAGLLRVRPWHPHAVFEVGIARPGWMGLFADMLAPDVVVVTSIASCHNRSFRTLEATRAEKARMVEALAPEGLAVLNGDDPHVRWMATRTRARVLTFGLAADNDVRASDVRVEWPSGTRLTLHADGQAWPLLTRLVGEHMVYPVLAAVTVALAEGASPAEVVSRIESVPPTPQRMQPIPLANGATILSDEYKAALETIASALDTLAAVRATRRVVVLGDIEEPPRGAFATYRELGARLARCADRAILVGSHSLEGTITGATRAGMARAALTYVGSSVHGAIALLEQELRAGDVVLVKGTASQRLDRVVLALQGRLVRCAVKTCKVRPIIPCDICPLLAREREAFQNVHLRRITRF
jgi:UDP-N-acetylmuramoyl-tripeptide--D-alanyl-D-alanine ligase